MDPQMMQLFLMLAQLAVDANKRASEPPAEPEPELTPAEALMASLKQRIGVSIPNAAPPVGGFGFSG